MQVYSTNSSLSLYFIALPNISFQVVHKECSLFIPNKGCFWIIVLYCPWASPLFSTKYMQQSTGIGRSHCYDQPGLGWTGGKQITGFHEKTCFLKHPVLRNIRQVSREFASSTFYSLVSNLSTEPCQVPLGKHQIAQSGPINQSIQSPVQYIIVVNSDCSVGRVVLTRWNWLICAWYGGGITWLKYWLLHLESRTSDSFLLIIKKIDVR